MVQNTHEIQSTNSMTAVLLKLRVQRETTCSCPGSMVSLVWRVFGTLIVRALSVWNCPGISQVLRLIVE